MAETPAKAPVKGTQVTLKEDTEVVLPEGTQVTPVGEGGPGAPDQPEHGDFSDYLSDDEPDYDAEETNPKNSGTA